VEQNCAVQKHQTRQGLEYCADRLTIGFCRIDRNDAETVIDLVLRDVLREHDTGAETQPGFDLFHDVELNQKSRIVDITTVELIRSEQ
jgi:hypothetical protein